MSNDKNDLGQKKQVTDIVRASLQTVVGMASTSPQEFLKLAVHAGGELLKGQASVALAHSYNFYMNKGRIDPAYFESTHFVDLAPEFRRVLEGNYGQDKLDALRRIFVNLAMDNGANSHMKYLLDIALDMSEPEIKTLMTEGLIGATSTLEEINDLRQLENWIAQIATSSGLRHGSLVELAESGLITKGLISDRVGVKRTVVAFERTTGRLTSMGQELYKLMNLTEDPLET
jgi:hypothetical protein